jgi:predicted nucleic acid-binding protein
MWSTWAKQGTRIVAPRLLYYEVTNSLFQQLRGGAISSEDVEASIGLLLRMDIEMYDDPMLLGHAFRITLRFNRPATYDSLYLALAEHLGIEFWTMDKRLYNAVHHHLPWVRLVE